MPPLPGFSDNPLRTREDAITFSESLLKPLLPYFSRGKASVCIPVGTGTHFDEKAAQLEGFARPLWAVTALLLGSDHLDHRQLDIMQPWLEGLTAGVNPKDPEYWGPIRDRDQKMVEAEIISFYLLAAPKRYHWDRMSAESRNNVVEWLYGMFGKDMPKANWLWFRVFAGLALIKTCGVEVSQIKSYIDDDLKTLDQFYLTDGWSGDGIWREPALDDEEWEIFQKTGRVHAIPNSRNACYYSGSFAIQFSQLLFIRFAPEFDPERTERYRQQARDFGAGFWRYFDADGAAIPFGRSLTYRFACGAFFAALALAKVPDMPEPLATPGAVRGFMMRHLRWWAKKSDRIFYPDGTLNFGWIYPNHAMLEDYNSPQSVYWALKSLVVTGLPLDDAFWQEVEVPYPDMRSQGSCQLRPAPRQITANHPNGNHHFLLSFCQFLGIPFRGAVAKYCKFAYSSSFGFSVPAGAASLNQIAPDNTLALSRDGAETWATKYKSADAGFTVLSFQGEEITIGRVMWHPWFDRCLEITTTMIPPTSRWPDWHVRIHRLRAKSSIKALLLAEGGFAINGRQIANTLELPLVEEESLAEDATVGTSEGVFNGPQSTLVLSSAGASGISAGIWKNRPARSCVSALKPEPNTNLMCPRTLIPLTEHDFPAGLPKGAEIILVTKVFAISTTANGGWDGQGKSLKERWLDQPQITFQEFIDVPNTSIH